MPFINQLKLKTMDRNLRALFFKSSLVVAVAILNAQLYLSCSSCLSQTAAPFSSELKIERRSYKSAGHDIITEWFLPPGSVTIRDTKNKELKPVLIILHGSGGIDQTGGFFRDMADRIARAGNIVVIVHYLDRNNLEWASNSQMSANFQTWLQTVRDAITFVKEQADIDPARISLFGHSLGAQLALHEAANDLRIHSIIDMAGCFVLPTSAIRRMPEILIWHGTADRVVPLTKEKALVKVLERTHTKYREEIFSGADHAFQKVDMNRLVKSATDFLNDGVKQGSAK
jgi:dienelactone hydrolase